MDNLTIEPLSPIRLPLLKKMYKQHYPSTKVKAEETIIVGQLNQALVGVVRLRKVDQYRLLTGMLVVPEHRSKGLASKLLDYCTRQQHLDNSVYCFAYAHLTNLYHKHGFKEITLDDTPGALNQLYLRYSRSGKNLVIMQYQDNLSI